MEQPVVTSPLRRTLAFAFLAMVVTGARAAEPLRVFAAASLTSALSDVASQWQKQGHPAPVLVFGASSALARQVEAGAPADVFASADLSWMDYLDRRGRIDAATRRNMLGNELALVAPAGRRFDVEMRSGFDLAGAFRGKLCTGEPGVVPVGIYARQSLEALGWWNGLEGRIVGTDDVRTALAFVERGECAAGIVYASDAAISDKVEIVARFPEDAHQPIVYPFALVRGAGPDAKAFLEFVATDAAAAAVFTRYGFSLLKP